MSRKFLLALLLIVTTLFLDATELRRSGWNLISVCQEMNSSEVDMTGIKEIQSQDGKSIYTGSDAQYSNLEMLEAGYGYWVKADKGTRFDTGIASGELSSPLTRDGWNLMASCEDIPSFDINLTEWNITEIQNQEGQSIYSGDWAEYSNLDGLENGYGYWVQGQIGVSWISKRGLSIPIGFDYQTINNAGEIIETTYEDLTIRLFVDYNETANDQANHTGIVVRINGQDAPLMQIQDTYRGHPIVVGVYDMDGVLVGVSEVTMVATEGAGTIIDVQLERNQNFAGFSKSKIVDRTFYMGKWYDEVYKQNSLESLLFYSDNSSLKRWYHAPLDASDWNQSWESHENWRIDENGSLITKEEHNITVHTWSDQDTNGSWYSCDLTEKYDLLNEFDDRYEVNASHTIFNCSEIDDPRYAVAKININLSNKTQTRTKGYAPLHITPTSENNETFSCICDWITSMDFNQPQPYTKDELRGQGYDDVSIVGEVELRDINNSIIPIPADAQIHIAHIWDDWHPALGLNALLLDGGDFNASEFLNVRDRYKNGQMMDYQIYIDSNHNGLFDNNEELLCQEQILFENLNQPLVCQSDKNTSNPTLEGGLPLVIIRIEFDDYQFRSSESVWHDKIFGNAQGELNHYYNEISYGKFHFKEANETYGVANDGIITVHLNENHPGDVDDFVNRINSAVALANSYIDFSIYDKNHNGAISKDELQLMYLVSGGESATGVTPGVWAYQWCMYGGNANAPTHDGVKLMSCQDGGNFSRFGERQFSIDGPDASIGVIAHELGHAVFGLPDLYDIDYSSAGIGQFGLMSGGSWAKQPGDTYPGETPVHMTGWSKIYSGFITPIEINQSVSNIELKGTSFNDYVLYKIETGNMGEYFLIENRSPSGYDMGLSSLEGTDSFSGGLSILHIDENQNGNSDENHKLVDIEEANNIGLDNKTHQGHINNLYFSGNVDNFSSTTTPNSNRYDGNSSGVSITNISDTGSVMSVDIAINRGE